MRSKLTSRKFWVSVAGMLASLGATFAGIETGSEAIAIAGIVCTALSGCIYAITEGIIDAFAVE